MSEQIHGHGLNCTGCLMLKVIDERDTALAQLGAIAALADRACICDECEAFRDDLRVVCAGSVGAIAKHEQEVRSAAWEEGVRKQAWDSDWKSHPDSEGEEPYILRENPYRADALTGREALDEHARACDGCWRCDIGHETPHSNTPTKDAP